MLSSDPVGVASSIQRAEDRPQQQEGHPGPPAGRILHRYEPCFHLLPSAFICFHVSFLHLCPAGRSQAPVFDVFEAFITTDNIQVFANAATDYILCLMKLVRGLGGCGLHQLWRSDDGRLCWL